MASLNQIAVGLADSVGQGKNHNLIQRLKLAIRGVVEARIRQDIERNGEEVGYSVRTIVPVSLQDATLYCNYNVGCTILASTNTIVKPVRLKGRLPFNYVGTIDGKQNFTYVSFEDIENFKHLRYIGNTIFWDIINDHLAIFNAKRLDSVMLDGYYTSTEILNCLSGTISCFNDDAEFPMPLDMLDSVKLQVRKSELAMYEANEVVNVNPETPIQNDR